MTNPYTNGSAVRDVEAQSRQHLVDRASRTLNDVAASGRAAPGVMSYVGPEGVGTDTVLDGVVERARQSGLTTVRVTFDQGGPNAQNLFEKVKQQLQEKKQSWLRKLRPSQTTAGVEAGIGVAKGSVQVQWENGKTEARQHNEQSLATVLRTVAEQQRAGEHQGVLVAVDGLDRATPEEVATVMGGLRGALRPDEHGQTAPIAVVASGSPQLADQVYAATGRIDDLDVQPVHRLDDNTARAMLHGPAAERGVTWDPRAAEEVVAASQGSPTMLRRYAAAAWDRADAAKAGDHIGLDTTYAAMSDVGDSLERGNFRAAWAASDDRERAVLTAVARTSDQMSISEPRHVSALLQADRGQWQSTADRLTDRGMLNQRQDGRVELAQPGFESYVLDRSATNRVSLEALDARQTIEARPTYTPRHRAEGVAGEVQGPAAVSRRARSELSAPQAVRALGAARPGVER